MITQSKTLYAFESDELEDCKGLSLSLEEPALDEANPVFPPGPAGAPDSGKIYYGDAVIAPWGGGYGLWYLAEDQGGRVSPCFAFSKEGWTWERREKAITGDFSETFSAFCSVFETEDGWRAPLTAEMLLPCDVPDERRRALATWELSQNKKPSGVVGFVGIATSRDGLDWQLPDLRPQVPIKVESPRYYHFQGRHLINAQTNGGWVEPKHPSARVVVFFESQDLQHWELVPGCLTNQSHEAIHGQTHIGILPVKRIDDRLLIGLGGRFDDAAELPDMHFETTLLYSRDGLAWHPVVPKAERRSWLRRGRRGEWDFGGVAPVGLVEDGDRAAVYYAATTVGNCAKTSRHYDPGPCAIGRMRFTRDRFAAQQPAVGWKGTSNECVPVSGTATTRPLSFTAGRTPTLNIQFPAKRRACVVEVEVLRPDGTVHDRTQLSEDGVAVPLRLDLPEAPARLRITLRGESTPDAVPKWFALEY